MSFYLSVPPTDYGIFQFQARAYGGFGYRENTLEKPSTSGEPISADPTQRFLTEHNLSLFWRRPNLQPYPTAFPVPLLHTADDYKLGARNRPPGNIRIDCAPIRYRNRNLLAGELVKGTDDRMRLWAVNDSSDHRKLLCYELELDDPYSCNRDKLLSVIRTMGKPTIQQTLPYGALQLRAMTTEHLEGKVFVRSNRSLELADTIQSTISPIFRNQVNSFIQIPYIDEEIAIVDAQGLLFCGTVENPSTFTRIKLSTPLREICSTDCPKVLLTLIAKELRQLDLREPQVTGQLLLSPSPVEQIQGYISEHCYTRLNEREEYWHLNSLDIQLETVLMTSSREHVLIDRRMPGLPLLRMPHAEWDGADYCVTTPSLTDPETGGRVFSMYSLTQIRKPAFSHWAVMYHPREGLWSSLGPKHELCSPRKAISQFVQLHVNMPEIATVENSLPRWTRAFHYQTLDQHLPISKCRALLFRQMEGGELWYENVFFDPLYKLKQDAEDVFDCDSVDHSMPPLDELALKKQSLEQISSYQQERATMEQHGVGHSFFWGVEKKLLARNAKYLKILDASEDRLVHTAGAEIADLLELNTAYVHNDVDLEPFAHTHHLSPAPLVDLRGEIDQLELERWKNPKRNLLSSCILNVWQKTSRQCQAGKERRLQKELGLMDISGEMTANAEEIGKTKKPSNKRKRKSTMEMEDEFEGHARGTKEDAMDEEEEGENSESGEEGERRPKRELKKDCEDFEELEMDHGQSSLEKAGSNAKLVLEGQKQYKEADDEYDFDVELD